MAPEHDFAILAHCLITGDKIPAWCHSQPLMQNYLMYDSPLYSKSKATPKTTVTKVDCPLQNHSSSGLKDMMKEPIFRNRVEKKLDQVKTVENFFGLENWTK